MGGGGQPKGERSKIGFASGREGAGGQPGRNVAFFRIVHREGNKGEWAGDEKYSRDWGR